MRAILSLHPHAPLNPFHLAPSLKATIIDLNQLDGLSHDDRQQLLLHDAESWSAGSIHLPGGRVGILLNPTHAQTRIRATLMEELSHIYLQHPSQLITVNGMAMRSFRKTHETQAYWVGAAALVPLAVLEHAQSNRRSRRDVASVCEVSTQLVGFREKVTGVRLTP
jgi:hypothetical protein